MEGKKTHRNGLEAVGRGSDAAGLDLDSRVGQEVETRVAVEHDTLAGRELDTG